MIRSKLHRIMLSLIFLASLLYADEIKYRAIKEVSLYEVYNSPSQKTRFGSIVPDNTTIIGSDFMKNIQGIYGHFYVTNGVLEGGYFIYANDLVPWDTIDTFNPDLLTQFSGPHQSRWIDSTLVNILITQKRDDFLQSCYFFRELYNPSLIHPYDDVEWYDYLAGEVSVSSMVYLLLSNACIISDIETMYLTNIKKMDYGYILSGGTIGEVWGPMHNRVGHDWTPVIGKESNFTMTLKIDGDFMDVYLEDSPTKFATYQLVDQKTIEQIVNLLRTETCDLMKVTWPLRASDLGGTGLIYRTVDRLKLRKSENRSSDVIRTLDIGAGMILLAKGSEETIDGITAPWVQVKTETGETGWCFGGYLDPKP